MREKVSAQVRWVPVVDGAGRRRLEMRWELPSLTAPQAVRRAA